MKLKVRIGKPSTIKARLKKPTKLRVRFGNVKITSEGYTPPTYEGATIVTPTKASQTLETDGYFVKADIKVNPIPNEYIVPEGVKEITQNGTYDVTDKKTAEVNVPIPEGYHDASGIGTVPSKVLSGNEYVNAFGKQVGTMPNNSRIVNTISYDGVSEVIIPEGYHPSGGYVNIEFEDKTVTPTKYVQIVEPGKRLTLGRVTVQPIPGQYIVPLGTKDITENGTHNVNEFQNVNVQVEAEIPEGYVELPTLTNEGTSADLVAGKELIDSKGQVVSGVIPIKTASNLTASGATVTVPAGLYEEQAAKSVATATQATPSISVSTAGKITAKATQSAGYVASGTKQATKQLTTQAAKTVTPTKSSQTAVASGRYTTGAVTVAPIPDEYIIPSGTKAITENGTHDVTEFAEVNVSVEGKEDVVLQSKTVTPTKSTQEVTADANYTALEKVTVNPIPNEYIIPQGSRELTVNYDLYDVRELEAVYVNVPNEIPDGYHDASGITTDPSKVLSGNEFVNQDGKQVGTMPNNSAMSTTLYYDGKEQASIPEGYHPSGGYVNIEFENRTVTPTKSTQTVKPGKRMTLGTVTVNPIPDSYIIPSGELPITANGTYDVTEKASVTVNVEGGGGGGESELPEGYKRCDYILFSGNQWVDTGIVGNQDTQINTCFTWENSTQRHLFGCASSDNTKSITSYMNGSWRFGAKSTSKSFGTKNSLLPYSVLVNKTTISTTNSATAISGVADFETVGTLLLGGARDADGTEPSVGIYARVYFFYMWQGEEQVRKLVPVTDGNGVYRFWDMVTKTFFDSITSNPLGGGMI